MKANQKAILEFENYLTSEGISKVRIRKYHYTLGSISRKLRKDFTRVTKKDLINFLAEIHKSDYSNWTKNDYKIVVKRFWKWFRQTDDYPEEVKWIRTGVRKNQIHMIKTQDILTEEEIYRMVEAAHHSRDKALISCLFET